MSEAGHDLIRLVERTILDQAHKEYAILREPLKVAIIHLLRATLHVLRDKESLPDTHHPIKVSLWYAQFLKAISFCLRWAYLECPKDSPEEIAPSPARDEAAEKLIFEWGLRYNELTIDQVAWTHGLLSAEVDEAKKIITFRPPADLDIKNLISQHAATLRALEIEMAGFPWQPQKELFNDWQRHAKWTERGLEFDSEFVRKHRSFNSIREWMQNLLFPELDGDVHLGEYTLGELRQFLSVAMTTGECVARLETLVDHLFGRNNAMGSWIFVLPEDQAVVWYASATGLREETVRSILGDLTGDLNSFHFSITTTPVIRIGDELIMGLRLLADLRPPNFVARVLTKGSGRRRYDQVSGLLERARLDTIEKRLRLGGLNVLREHTFIRGTARFTPDLVIWDRTCARVFVIDFKNSLSAIGAAEVANRTRELRKGISQVEGYLQHLHQDPLLLSRQIERAIGEAEVRGGLLFWFPLGIAMPRHPELMFNTWTQILDQVGQTGPIALADLVPKSEDLPLLEMTPRDIRVGEWTYRRYVWGEP
jgi:hypothetical protein